MKRNILRLSFLSAFIIGITSCTNLLDIKETDFIAGETALRTVQNNESLVMGAYNAFSGQYMAIRLNAVFSDEIKPGDFYARQSTHEWRFASDDVTIRDDYTATTEMYRVIDRANRVLEALPNAIAEQDSDEALRSRVEGEALFLRAFAHFELFRYYAGNYDPNGLAMPYMLEPSLGTHERMIMSDYFDLLLSDLVASKALLPNNTTDVNRTNRIAANGLHARVALYMRDWPTAITQSTEYINALPLATRAQFPAIWKDESTAEVAWRLARNTSSRMGSWFMGIVTVDSEGEFDFGQTSWIPSDKLWDSYTDGEDDIRFTSYLVDEPLLAADGRQSRLVRKYAGTGYATSNENVAHIKMFRTAEMYLIRAEAYAETGSISGANSAESDINSLRAARIDGYTNVTFGSKDVAIEAILEERFKELALEGHRFWDLKRHELPVERLASDAPSSDGRVLPANNFRFVLPIPLPEMLANPKMVQNPGYAN